MSIRFKDIIVIVIDMDEINDVIHTVVFQDFIDNKSSRVINFQLH